MILVTGPTGNTGSLVVELLRDKGVPFVCMARRQTALRELRSRGLNAVCGDFDKPETLPETVAGITKAYLTCTPDDRLVQREGNFINAAKAAGVSHIVKLSGILAAPDAPTPILRFHGEVEAMLRQSGVGFTMVRPHGFMQTLYFMSQATISSAGDHGLSRGARPSGLCRRQRCGEGDCRHSHRRRSLGKGLRSDRTTSDLVRRHRTMAVPGLRTPRHLRRYAGERIGRYLDRCRRATARQRACSGYLSAHAGRKIVVYKIRSRITRHRRHPLSAVSRSIWPRAQPRPPRRSSRRRLPHSRPEAATFTSHMLRYSAS